MNGFWQRIFLEHFAAVVGLPAAAIASLFIVIILEASSGNIEFKGWGLNLKERQARL